MAFAGLVCVALVGCGARDPLGARITAETPIGLQMWMTRAPSRLSPEQVGDLKEAMQELRFKIMSEGKVSGSEPVEVALCGEIDGRTVREVMVEGFGRQADRLSYERKALAVSARENARIAVRPGDTASAEYLDRVRGGVSKRLQDAIEAESRAKRILAGYSQQND
jgi:hypothetical protein